MFKLKKIAARVASTCAVMVLGTSVSFADQYPSKPVKLIVPYVPGGTTDVVARQFAQTLQTALGQSVVVENKPGVSGTLGALALKAAPADGYTISLMPVSVFRQPFIQKTAYDPAKDFTYLGRVTGYMFGVVVRADSPWKTWADFLKDTKGKPDSISYGSPGMYSTPHTTMIQLSNREKMSLIHMPFKSDGECLPALMGNHVQACAAGSAAGALVDSGKLRWLNIWTAKRASRWPDAPTLNDLGYDLSITSPYGIAAPKGLDPKVAQILEASIKRAAEDPAHLAILRKQDQELLYLNAADYTRFALDQIKVEKKLVDELGIGAQ